MLDLERELKEIARHLATSHGRVMAAQESLRRVRDTLLKSEDAIGRSKATLNEQSPD
jgi:hypothetical protein